MEQRQKSHEISVTWRGGKYVLEMTSGATLRELGNSLQKLTDVKADTLRLIVRSNKSSKLLSPFSDEHSCLKLQETSIFEGKSIMMMGVPKDEVDQVLLNAKADMRIAGFDEEEKRLRQRMLSGPGTPLKLPQGNYVFCEFRTLHIPGIELNPPASEALKLMHMLAADPGIVAVMNKHRWRVGIMTEMAPEGYVGVSPVCILGFNKNQGEEISLRLRTDDLKGFRKYQSIKKTLLHELAHMIYSEHDANFYALDKQLNQEAASLDWTRSRSQTLSGIGISQHHEEEFYTSDSSSFSQKLGGKGTDQLANARVSSVAAAFRRLERALSNVPGPSEAHEEPDPDDFGLDIHQGPDCAHTAGNELNMTEGNKDHCEPNNEPDPDDGNSNENKIEPDPDDSRAGEIMESEPYNETNERRNFSEPDPDDSEMTEWVPPSKADRVLAKTSVHGEPDPDDLDSQTHLIGNFVEPDPDDSQNGVMTAEPDLDNSVVPHQGTFRTQTDEPDPDDQEFKRIQDPVTIVCGRLKKAIEMLQSEVNPSEAVIILQTLFKIIRNVIEHPDEVKFRKLRKANPIIQRNVASHKAALEILLLIGFSEDTVLDEIGKVETYLILKRNDPGLLWLAKSSIEACIAY